MASHLQEEKLLRAAYAYEQATHWHTLQPGVLHVLGTVAEQT